MTEQTSNVSFAERLAQAKESLIRRIPIRAKSLEDFATKIEQEGGTAVSVLARTHSESVEGGGSLVGMTHTIGTAYRAEFSSETQKGRRIKFGEYYGYTHVFDEKNDPTLIEQTTQRLLATVNHRLSRIQEQLPEVAASFKVATSFKEPPVEVGQEARDQLENVDNNSHLTTMPDGASLIAIDLARIRIHN